MLLVSTTALTHLGLTLITGAVKYYKDNATEHTVASLVLDSFDGLFSGVLGNIFQEGYNNVRQKLESINSIEHNADIERCSRLALLNALISFSEACKMHLPEAKLSLKEQEICRHFLTESQKHFNRQIKPLAKLDDNDIVFQRNPLTKENQLENALARVQDRDRITAMRAELTDFVLREFSYTEGNLLHKQLQVWLAQGLPNSRHWFVYYIHELHANLKKDVPIYCKNARIIIQQIQLAEINLFTQEILAILNPLMKFTEEIRGYIIQVVKELEGVKEDIKEIKAYTSTFGDSEILLQQLAIGSQRYYDELRGITGPYYHINIANEILAGIAPTIKSTLNTQSLIHTHFKDNIGNEFSLKEGLQVLWQQNQPYTILLADGGMGKTVSLLHFWETLLKVKDKTYVIPIFLTLNEYNTVSERERDGFIFNRIAWHYLGIRENRGQTINTLWKAFKAPATNSKPTIILMLDGFNEITVGNSDKNNLLLELRELQVKATGVQIVLTSRYEMNFNWAGGFQTLTLQSISQQNIKAYLEKQQVVYPDDERLRQLLQNPLMLTLFANVNESIENYKNDINFDFKQYITTQAELMWNFLEKQIIKLASIYNIDTVEFKFNKFLIRHLLPFIGYQMDLKGQYVITDERMEEILSLACQYFYRKDFIQTFSEFRPYLKKFNINLIEFDEIEQDERFEEIKKVLCQELRLMLGENWGFKFLHQIFRDFFAAVHILNALKLDLKVRASPEILKINPLPIYIRQFIGQLDNYHYSSQFEPVILSQVLDFVRGVFDQKQIGYIVFNIICVWKETYPNLSFANFSNLNLSNIDLQEVLLYQKSGVKYQSTRFDYSLINENCFLHNGHRDGVRNATYSPDGKRFVSTSGDHTLKVWDAQTGQCLVTCEGHITGVWSVVYSFDGERFVSTSGDHALKVWDAQTGQCLLTCEGHIQDVSRIVYSPDGECFVSGSEDHTLKIWNAHTGQCLVTCKGHNGGVRSVAYSPGGEYFVSASWDHTLKVWDARTGQCLVTCKGHTDAVTSVVYSPDGERFVSASGDQTLKIWDAQTGQCLVTCEGHTDGVINVACSPDGKRLVSVSRDKTFKVWDAQTGLCSFTCKGNTDGDRIGVWDFLWNVVYSLDGERFVSTSGDHTLKVWDAQTGQFLFTCKGHKSGITNVAYSPNGERFVSTSWDHTLKVWDALTGQCLVTCKGNKANSKEICIVHSPDGEHFVSISDDHTIRVWDALAGQYLFACEGLTYGVRSVAYSPDGERFISASEDHTLKVWDARTGQCLVTCKGHTDAVTSVVYSPDGERFVSASGDQTLKIWDAQTGQCLVTCEGHIRGIRSVAYSLNGKRFTSTSWDHTLKVWDAQTSQCLFTCERHNDVDIIDIWDVVYSPDGERFILGLGSQTLKVMDVQTDQFLFTCKGHNSSITSIVYSANGERFISTSWDHTLKIWDALTGQCLVTCEGHTDGVTNVACSPDGKSLVSASRDKTFKIWNAHTGQCLHTFEGCNDGVRRVTYTPDGKRFISTSGDHTLKVWDAQTGHNIYSIQDMIGLHIVGCSFMNLHANSKLSHEIKDTMRQYGGIFNKKDEERWSEIIQRMSIDLS